MKKTLLVDSDEILAHLSAVWYPKYNVRKPEGYPDLTVESMDNWDMQMAHQDTLWGVIAEPGLYRNLPVLPGATKGLKAIHDSGKYDIYIVTSATAAAHTPTEKIQWIQEYFPFITRKQIISCHAKHLIRGDFLIDDGPRNMEGWLPANPDGIILTIDYPYNAPRRLYLDNQTQKRIVRCGGWQDTETAWNVIVENLVHYR